MLYKTNLTIGSFKKVEETIGFVEGQAGKSVTTEKSGLVGTVRAGMPPER